MARKVLIGGFASGWQQLEKVASILSERYNEDVYYIPFRVSMDEPSQLERLVHNADVMTHSAGALALRGTQPERITMVAPPVPVCAPFLAARAIASIGSFAFTEVVDCLPGKGAQGEVGGCLRDGTVELGLHLYGNIRQLNEIAAFDSIEAANAANAEGIETDIIFMSNDQLFQVSSEKAMAARKMGTSVFKVPGVHEDLIWRPNYVLDQYGVQTTSTALSSFDPVRVQDMPSIRPMFNEA